MKKCAPWRCTSKESWRQLTLTLISYLLLFTLAYLNVEHNKLLSVLLAILTGLIVVRIFVIQHDCAHGSYFRSHRLNSRVGSLLGVITMVPHHYWQYMHLLHHATSGNLDRRGQGDIWMLTCDEYCNLSYTKKTIYRLYRHPIAIILFGPLLQFVIGFRFSRYLPARKKRERNSVRITNIAILLLHAGILIFFDYENFLFIYLIVVQVSAASGIILFYVQHQLEKPYWATDKNWNLEDSALDGAGYLQLSEPIAWLFGYINLHHVHHLKPGIVNYRLKHYMIEKGLNSVGVKVLPSNILYLFSLKLYDETTGFMVGFSDMDVEKNMRETT